MSSTPAVEEARSGGQWATAWRISVQVLALAVVVQFLLAGLGIFTSPTFFFFHAVVNAALIFVLSLLVLLLGWRGGAGRSILRLSAAIPALVVLQSILLTPYHMAAPAPIRAIASLHVVNALVIFWIVATVLQRLPRRPDVA